MDQIHLMKVFISVVELGSFAATARNMNLSAPAVTRAINELEQRLGVSLLIRTTRYVRPTEAGLNYANKAREIIQLAHEAEEEVLDIHHQPRGHLSVTAPVLFGKKFVTPCLVKYLEKYPQTRITTTYFDRVSNLLEENFDVGIRIGALPDSNMYAIGVGEVDLITCASPQYLKKHGTLKSPSELQQHNVIVSPAMVNAFGLTYELPEGGQKHVPVSPRLVISENEAIIDAALSHFGIIRVLSYQVYEHLKSGALVPLLQNFQPKPIPVQIVHREGRNSTAKLGALIKMLSKHLKKQEALGH